MLVGAVVFLNLKKQAEIDKSKLPQKVELSKGFQRWITNLKNKEVNVAADDFRLYEETEIYNTKWIKVYSIDEPGKKEEFDSYIKAHENLAKVIFSPSQREFIDYRDEPRDGYNSNEVHFYGQKEDKIIDARLLDCSVRANCYFDRAYFLDNDSFVASEISRNIPKKDYTTPECPVDQTCTYTIKVHVIDLINNKRLTYESKPFDTVLSELITEL